MISKHFSDLDEAAVCFAGKVPIDPYGRPRQTTWACAAFCVSDHQLYRRNQALEEERLLVEMRRRRGRKCSNRACKTPPRNIEAISKDDGIKIKRF